MSRRCLWALGSGEDVQEKVAKHSLRLAVGREAYLGNPACLEGGAMAAGCPGQVGRQPGPSLGQGRETETFWDIGNAIVTRECNSNTGVHAKESVCKQLEIETGAGEHRSYGGR